MNNLINWLKNTRYRGAVWMTPIRHMYLLQSHINKNPALYGIFINILLF